MSVSSQADPARLDWLATIAGPKLARLCTLPIADGIGQHSPVTALTWHSAEVGAKRVGSPDEGVSVKLHSTRHWTDWVGAAVFLAIGINLWRQSAEFGVLILPSLLQELLVIISFLVRPQARRMAPDWTARTVAYAHTFGIMAFLLYATAQQPDWIRPTPIPELRSLGAILWLLGAALSLWPLWYLRRAFSVEPEARSLVTAGPYRLARHPIYAVYLWINIGILLRHFTMPLTVALIVWTGLLFWRIRYEEAVLTDAFPAYREYQRQVGALWPKLKPRMLR